MHRITTTLVLALFLLGCGLLSGPVQLVTIEGPVGALRGCFANPRSGELIVDRTHGTAFKVDEGGIEPVMWPPGYTGRWVGSEVEVSDAAGNVIATTGRRYSIAPMYEVPLRSALVAGCVDPWVPSEPNPRDPL
jgi:hypothetical protein